MKKAFEFRYIPWLLAGGFFLAFAWITLYTYYPLSSSTPKEVLLNPGFQSILIFALLGVLISVVYFYFRNRQYIPVALTFFFGITLAALLAFVLEDFSKRQGYIKFAEDAKNRIGVLEREIELELNAVHSLKGLFDSSGYVTRDEFRSYTTDILNRRNSGIHTLNWILHVPASEEGLFEWDSNMSKSYLFRISEKDEEGRKVNAGIRKEYFPILYVEPIDGNEASVAYDLGSETIFLDAIEQSRYLGKMTATQPFKLWEDPNAPMGFMAFEPVMDKEDKTATRLADKRLMGFVAATFRIDHLLETASEYLEPAALEFEIYDQSEEDSIFLVYSQEGKDIPMDVSALGFSRTKASLWYEKEMRVAGRKWLIVAKSEFKYYFAILLWVSRTASAAILIFTIMIIMFQVNYIRRNTLIEEAVLRRTKELSEAKNEIETKARELQAVNDELDGFVYTASHDLKSPLKNIVQAAETIVKKPISKIKKTDQKHLDMIVERSQRMTALIDDLTLLSRVTRIRNPYEKTNMRELCQYVIDQCDQDIKESNAKVTVDANLPVVTCDRIKITQAVTNLLSNAIKFSTGKEKKPKIQIGFNHSSKEDIFFIKDNGIGIKERNFDKIFDFYIRLHTEDAYPGTGAGLSIVKKIIEDHQGRVWVESTFGEGSTFYFTIPKRV